MVPLARRSSHVPAVRRRTAGWCLTEIGRQPWVVQGLLKTNQANSPTVRTTWLVISLGVFLVLYVALLVVDFWLMRRYASVDPRRSGARRAAPSRRRVLAPDDLQNLWFIIIAFFWAGYFMLEGFDFGVGMLLPFLPRDEGERRAMFASIGPVWDGNEVWLVVAGGATFAAFPGWYASMFSGLLPGAAAGARVPDRPRAVVRVADEEREPAAGARSGRGPTRPAASAPSLVWGVGLGEPAVRRAAQQQRRLHRQLLGSLQPLHAVRRRRVRAPVHLPRRDLPDAAHHGRSVRAGGSHSPPARDPGRRLAALFVVATVVVATSTTTRASSRRCCRRCSRTAASCSPW